MTIMTMTVVLVQLANPKLVSLRYFGPSNPLS
jgi:hypothetical protein